MEPKRVLILGAGLVARPMVRYLLEHGFEVTVASRTVSKAEALVDGHVRGRALTLLVEDQEALAELVADTDLAVSLLPANKHLTVARLCLDHGRPMVTTSYISPQMQALDEEARAKGLILLNECGVDPGIDHMSAMQVIHRVRRAGGHITSFTSWCGGLPAPEALDNPWYYKFSWSPRGVLVAAMSSARWLEEGEERSLARGTLFLNHRRVEVPAVGSFEGYPNRDSTGYVEVYGLDGIRTMLRGTLRLPGHCERWHLLVRMGLMDAENEVDLRGRSLADLVRERVGGSGGLEEDTAAWLGLDPDSEHLAAMRWLGLFDQEPLSIERGARIDGLAARMQQRMPFEPGQRDMIVLQHEFLAEYPRQGRGEEITATMVDYGILGGDSSMARTVSLPAAIGVRMVLEGRIRVSGVHRPVVPELYEPILQELATLDIEVKEETRPRRL